MFASAIKKAVKRKTNNLLLDLMLRLMAEARGGRLTYLSQLTIQLIN